MSSLEIPTRYRVLAELERSEDQLRARAIDEKTGREVLLWLGRPVGRHAAHRFDDLATLVSFVHHPAIAAYLAHGSVGAGPTCFWAWEWIEGETLEARLARAPLAIEESLALAQRIGGALAVAHAFGIAHGAVDAQKTLLRESGACLIELGSSSSIGAGAAHEDARAFGRLVYRCITGIDPRPDRSDYPGILESGADLPHFLAALIERLAIGPASNFRDMRDVMEAFVPRDELEATFASGEGATLASGDRAPRPAPVASFGDRYAIHGEIARGGMGVILDAKDARIHRHLALKMLLAGHGRNRELELRFLEEAQIQGQLEHPSICPVHELGEDQAGHPYFTMKKVRGRSLGEILRTLENNPEYSLNRRLEIFIKICEAIAFAHARQVIHRDLKPDNIMVGELGEVLVMDWGLAKVLGKTEVEAPFTARASYGAQLSISGRAMGTPSFMPPEQAESAADVDHRADIYSLGAILYQILTLKPPVEGDSVAEILLNVVRHNIQRPSARAPELAIPPDLEAATMKALARSPEDRYPSAEALRDDIRAYLDGRTLSAAEYSLYALFSKWVQRNRTFVSTAAAAIVLLVASGLFYLVEITAARSDAEHRLASALVAQGKARAEAERWSEARAAFVDSLEVAKRIGAPAAAAELGLERAHRHAPPPLYTEEAGHELRAVAFLPDRVRAVTAGEQILLWDVASGTRVRRLAPRAAKAIAVEVSRDGRRIVVLSEDDTIRSIDPLSFAVTSTLTEEETGSLQTIALMPDGNTVLTGDEFGHIRGRNLDTGRDTEPARELGLPVHALAVGNLIIASGRPGRMVAWRPGAAEPVYTAIPAAEGVSNIEVSSAGRKIAVSSIDQPIIQLADLRRFRETSDWNLNPGKKNLTGHGADLVDLQFSAEGDFLVSSDQAGKIMVWDSSSGEIRRTFDTGFARRTAAAISPDARLVLSADAGGIVQLWKLGDLPVEVENDREPIGITSSAFLEGERLIAHVDAAGVTLEDVRTRARIGRFGGMDLRAPQTREAAMKIAAMMISRSAISADGTRLVVKRQRGPLEVIALPGGEPIRALNPPHETVYGLAISPDGRFVVAAGFLGEKGTTAGLIWFDTTSSEPLKVMGEMMFTSIDGPLAISPDSKLVLAGGTENRDLAAAARTASVWSLADGKLRAQLRGHEAGITAVAFSPDGRMAFTASQDRTARMWSVATGTVARVFRGETRPITALAVSPNGALLATGSGEGTVRIWDVASGEELETWPVHQRRINALAFSRDGGMLVSATDRGGSGVFHLDRVRRDARLRPSVEAARRALAIDPLDGRARAVLAEWYALWGEWPSACALFAGVMREEPSLELAKCRADRGDVAGARAVLEVMRSRGVLGAGEADRRLAVLAEQTEARTRDRDHRGRTALHAAAVAGDLTRVRELLAGGADPNSVSTDGRSVLIDVALRNRLEIARVLLDHRADPNATNAEGLSPLIGAAQNAHLDMMRLLVARGADPNRQSAYGIVAIHKVAANHGDRLGIALIEALVALGADVDAVDSVGHTALHYAVESGLGPIVDKLLDLGANPNLADSNQRAPLFIAVEKRMYGAAKRLLVAGADPSAGTAWQKPLHLACRNGDVSMAMLLVDHGAELESAAPDGTSPITAALLAEKTPVVVALLRRGADPVRRDALGRSPLEILVDGEHAGVLRMVAARGVRFAEQSDAGVGLLQYAVRRRKWYALEEMLLFADRVRDREAIARASEEAKRMGEIDAAAILSRALAD